MRRGRIVTCGAIAIASAFAVAAPAAAQKLYKWTDENGKVHYTDKAPDASRGGTQLDKQGRAVGRIEPALTPEQARAKEAEDERKQAAAREQEVRETYGIPVTAIATLDDVMAFIGAREDLAKWRDAVTAYRAQYGAA